MDPTDFIRPIIISILAIFISLFLFFYAVSYAFIILRLVKSSCKLDSRSLSELFVSYNLQFILYLYIIFTAGLYSHEKLYTEGSEPVIFAVLIMLYIGRIISTQKGAFYGKAHFTALITSSLFLIILTSSNTLFSGEFVINLSHSGISAIVDVFADKISLMHIDNIYLKGVVGIAVLSTLGEMALSRFPPSPKSFLGISEYIPDLFSVLGAEKFSNTIDNMLEDKGLEEIKGATTSLWIVERLFLNHKFPKFKCKLLKLPKKGAVDIYLRYIYDVGPSLATTFYLDKVANEFIVLYNNRVVWLEHYINIGVLEAKENAFVAHDYLLFKYKNNIRKLLFITVDTNIKDQIGILVEEPLIVDIFESIFDISWDKGDLYRPIAAQINKDKLNIDQRPWWWK